MFEKLQDSAGKNITVELVNGRILSGSVLTVDEEFLCIEAAQGIATVPLKSVQIVWEPVKQNQTEEKMQRLVAKLRDSARSESDYAEPQIAGNQQFVGWPPQFCPGFFTCTPFQFWFPYPANAPAGYGCSGQQFYGQMDPAASGNNPAFCCEPFQHGQTCMSRFQQPCMSHFQQPCTSQFQQPCVFQHQPTCNPFTFNTNQCFPSNAFNCTVWFSSINSPSSSPPSGVAPVSYQPVAGFPINE